MLGCIAYLTSQLDHRWDSRICSYVQLLTGKLNNIRVRQVPLLRRSMLVVRPHNKSAQKEKRALPLSACAAHTFYAHCNGGASERETAAGERAR